MVHRKTKQLMKSNCDLCRIIWDMWVEMCQMKPPAPSMYHVRNIRGRINTMKKKNG